MKKAYSFFAILFILFLSTGCKTSPGPDNSTIHTSGLLYEIRMPAPHTHYLEISITIEKPGGSFVDIAMPAWSPGRYIIYDFAKHVYNIEVFSGGPGKPVLKRLDKQTWRVSGYGRDSPTLAYNVYANYASGTFSHVSSEGVLINGASVFMYPVRAKNIPITLDVCLPDGKNWTIATGLPAIGTNRFYADNYDHLIDSPLSIGNIRSFTFPSNGKPIHICFQSPDPEKDYEKTLALNCKALCDTAGRMFDGFPFSDYLFIFYTGFAPGKYDGMEHMNSSCITDIIPISKKHHVKKFTALAAHEFFHVWNVKCIRPYEFLSYNLAEETYTQSLWIVEGITRYFQNVLQLRAGLITRKEFRQNLASYISAYELKPGKKKMTLEQASFLTWFDRGNEEDTNRTNIRISYYNKGALVGLLLDMKIRGLTAGQRGLEDVFKSMYTSYYKKGRGYASKDFYSECEKITGVSLSSFFSICVQGTGPLPYTECAGLCGFIIKNSESPPVPDSGIELYKSRIINIIPGSAAEKAGFQKYDKIVQVNGNPFTGNFDIKPGQRTMITFLRYGKTMTLPLVAGEKTPVFFLFKEKALLPVEIIEIREAFYTGQIQTDTIE